MTRCSCVVTARGLITAADELQKFLVEQLNSFAAGLLMKRGVLK